MKSHLIVILGVGLGCRGPGDVRTAGRLELEWRDSARQVRFAAPARARWCGQDSSLEITGVRNDTAIGVALYPRDSTAGGLTVSYPVRSAQLPSSVRPQAAAALRLVEVAALKYYESGSGQVRVAAGQRRGLSGRLDLRLAPGPGVRGPDWLHLTGRFSRIEMVPAERPCGRLNPTPPG